MLAIKLLIVDDHHMFLEGVNNALSQNKDFEVVDACTNGKDALKILKSKEVELLITDMSMPEINGIELVKQAKAIQPSLKILIVSMFKQLQSFDNIDGYLLKETSYDELIKAIKQIVLENKRYFYSSYTKRDEKLEFKKNILTTREKEIVCLIAKQFSVDDIAEKLFLSRHTVETHKKNIFQKLQVKNAAGLVKKAIYLGYIDY